MLMKMLRPPCPRQKVQAAEPPSTAGCLETEAHSQGGPTQRGGQVLLASHLQEEGEGVVPQLLQEPPLDLGVGQLLLVLQLRINLPRHHKQVPPEGHAHHVHVLPTVLERARQHHVNWGQVDRWTGEVLEPQQLLLPDTHLSSL